MDNNIHLRFEARDRSYFSILKKEIHAMALDAGFSETKTGRIDIIVAEMASNLVKHAGGGELLVRADAQQEFIELISIDNGPGIVNPARMLEDGVSTTNTLGQGLGAMKRLSDHFDLFTIRNWGSLILSRVFKKDKTVQQKKPLVEIRSLVVAKPGETVSGDIALHKISREGIKLFLGDGLGHGEMAHEVAAAAGEVFRTTTTDVPCDILREMHVKVRKTRGLVASIACYTPREKKWRLCGVGNIATRTVNGLSAKNHVSYNGIVGMNIPNSMKEQEWDSERGQVMIMCSDGIRSHIDISRYPSIMKYDLSVLAAAIYKDYSRQTDDMSIIVSRVNPD